MKEKKSTKRAFILSVLVLLLCICMFIGMTTAWFTDTVTSSGNKIQSGSLRLDLELYDKDTNTWNSIKESKQAIFNHDKWEPGYTDVKLLKIENEGTLSAKWVAKFVANQKLSELANVIDVYVCPSETELTYPADRNLDGYVRVGTVAEFVNTIESTTKGTLDGNQVAYLGIALRMQDTADNKYQNLSIGGAFDIRIEATQYATESDSFDNQYDTNATTSHLVSDIKDLIDACNKGGEFVLTEDINLTTDNVQFRSGNYITAILKDVTLDLNGHTITVDLEDRDANNGMPTLFYVYTNATLNIVGEGNLIAKHDACLIWPRSDCKGVNIYGGNYYNIDETSGETGDIMGIIYSSGGQAHVYGGTFTYKNVNGHCGGFNVQDSNSYANEIVLHEGVLLSNSNYYKGQDGGKIALAEGCVLKEVVIDGVTWYQVVAE